VLPPNFWISLVAVLVGNALYFFLVVPMLPYHAQHNPFKFDVGLLVDFWVCLVVYGLLRFFWKPGRPNTG